MSRTLTASDRKALIRLASAMEKGSPERKAILAGLFSDFDDLDIDPDRMEGMNKIENMIKPLTKRRGALEKIVIMIGEEASWEKEAGNRDMINDLNKIAKKVMDARDLLRDAEDILRRY